jgi:acetyl/propionyl-CoA carboxylase alpha subunit
MRLMGDKVAARRTMIAASVPVVAGTDLLTDSEEAQKAALRLGLPVLIKAAAGGGGKGIRVVRTEDELGRALELAAGESLSAFGDSSVYIEKLLSPVRHIEVQVMADHHGHTIAVGERECSIQRRNQKLIEEAPSVAVTSEVRERLFHAAVSAAEAAGYRNAGTVEFLMDTSGDFYFLEMNTRLQVEHPVTEMVTGFDLAAEQIRIAAGEPLSFGQQDVVLRGHAIECRITAEDAANGFAPSVGLVHALRHPAGPGIRVDSELSSGVEVSVFYDPMIAKLIAWGRDRDEAIRRMRRALGEYVIGGVQTNIAFHLQMLADARFIAGDIHTRLLDEEFTFDAGVSEGDQLIAAVAATLAPRTSGGPSEAQGTRNGGSAWRESGRLSAMRGWYR